MERLTRVAARGFQGADFDEALPPRLLLTGPNGSGKTTRLRAITRALLGTGKDGLAPWATTDLPSVVVEATTGLRVQRASKITRDEAGGMSVANRSAVEPSQGEKTAEAVAARIERELAPNVLALTLDAFWKLSGAERRRALLDAIGAGAALDPQEIRRRLDAEFARPDEVPVVRRAWDRVSAAVRPVGDGMAYLAALEGAAKAQASAYRANRAGVDALAGVPTAAAQTVDVDTLRRSLAAADQAVSDLEGALAAGARGAADRAARQRDVERLRAALPDDVRGLPQAARAEAVNAAVVRSALAIPGLVETAESAAAASTAAAAAVAKAREAVARSDGRLRALRALLAAPAASEDADGDDPRCPVCARPGYDPAWTDAAVGRATDALERSRRAAERAAERATAAAGAATKAEAALADARKAHDAAKAALEVLARLDEAERLLAGGAAAATPVPDAAAVQAAREHRDALRAQIDAAAKAEGERKVRLEAARAAGEAEDLARAAVRIQAAVGPKGLQGSLLADPADRLTAAMTEAWRRAGRAGALAFRLADPRGAADARVVHVQPSGGREVDLASLSGGERAVALACLVCGLAALRPERMSVALIEAGEVDRSSLLALCGALGLSSLATVVVATHVDPGVDDVPGATAGFVVRRL